MGAYLYFKLDNKEEAVSANNFLETLEQNIQLKKEGIYFSEPSYVQYVKEQGGDEAFALKQVGKGDVKTSGIECRSNMEIEMVLAMQTEVFEELNKRFSIKYYAGSCAFTIENNYYSTEQMKRITNNGTLLSGKTLEKYQELIVLLEEPELIDISIIKEKDKLLIGDEWREVTRDYNELQVQTGINFYNKELLTKLDRSIIKEHKKFVPKVRYLGAIADIESFIKDRSTLIQLEIIGQEQMVKAISSVLMQGRVKLNDHNVEIPHAGWFDINKAGNKRKLMELGNGISHSLVYHHPSIAAQGFNILIGKNKEELHFRFEEFMDKTNPIPYPKELIKEIFIELKEQEYIEELESYNIEAVKINLDIFENDGILLQEIILKVCRNNGLISPDAKPMKEQAPLPKSPILTPEQVKKVYETLEKMPKTYETENMSIKPIGLKLFTSSMTWYVIEADIGSDDDKFQGVHSQAFGYVKNENAVHCSEYGYINIEEVIKCGAEMDLYFKNQYIKGKTIGTMDEIIKLEQTPSCPNCGRKKGIEYSERVDGFDWFNCIDCGNEFKQKITIDN